MHGAAQEVHDVEKVGDVKVEPVISNEEVQTSSTGKLHKDLRSRHMQMIAIGKLCDPYYASYAN